MSIKNQEQALILYVIFFIILLPSLILGPIHAIKNCILEKKTLKAGSWINYSVETKNWKQRVLKMVTGTYLYIMLFEKDKGQDRYSASHYWTGKNAFWFGIGILFYSLLGVVAFLFGFYVIYIKW